MPNREILRVLTNSLMLESLWWDGTWQTGRPLSAQGYWAEHLPLLEQALRAVAPTEEYGLICTLEQDSWFGARFRGGTLLLGPLVPRTVALTPERLYEVRFRYVDEIPEVASVALAMVRHPHAAPTIASWGPPTDAPPESGLAPGKFYQSPIHYFRRTLRERILNTVRSGDPGSWESDASLIQAITPEALGVAFDAREYRKQFTMLAALAGQAAEESSADAWAVQALQDRYLDWISRVETPAAFATLLHRMVTELTRAVEKAPFRDVSSAVSRAIANARQRLGSAVTLASLAQSVGLSPHYLIHRLQVETGGGFRDLMARLRVEEAQKWLRTDKPIAEVASIVGFRYANHFARVFRAQTGSTPSDYRAEWLRSRASS